MNIYKFNQFIFTQLNSQGGFLFLSLNLIHYATYSYTCRIFQL